MTQTYKVQVSMNQAHIVESGFVWKQGDFGFNIEIEVLDFDTTGATPQIIFRKSTGAVEATEITRAGNKFTYAIRGTELDTPGPCVCDLKLNDSTTKRVSTASFKYFVIPDTMDGLNQQASSYSDTVAQIVDGFNDNIDILKESLSTQDAIIYNILDNNSKLQLTWKQGLYNSSMEYALSNEQITTDLIYLPLNSIIKIKPGDNNHKCSIRGFSLTNGAWSRTVLVDGNNGQEISYTVVDDTMRFCFGAYSSSGVTPSYASSITLSITANVDTKRILNGFNVNNIIEHIGDLSGFSQGGAYLIGDPDISGAVGKNISQFLNTTVSGVYTASIIDVSSYKKKYLRICYSVKRSSSVRAFGFCDANGVITRAIREKEVKPDTNYAYYIALFEITGDYLWFSWGSADESSSIFTVDVIDLGSYYKMILDSQTKDRDTPVYVSPTGSDQNPGTLDFPFATVTHAISVSNNVNVLKGTYIEQIDFSKAPGGIIEINNYNPTGVVEFKPSGYILGTSATATSGYENVKQMNVASMSNLDNNTWIYQENVPDTETLIDNAERLPQQRGYEYRCDDTRIKKATSGTLSDALAEIEAATDYRWYYDADNAILYFSSPSTVSSSYPITRPVADASLLKNVIRPHVIHMHGIWTKYMPFNVSGASGIEIVDCKAANVYGGGAFIYNQVDGGKFIRCEATRCVSGSTGDGFNGHSNTAGNKHSKQTTIQLIDCWSHDNQDDGYSDHERSETEVHGGLFEYNGKAGITPSYGSHCCCYDVISRHNCNGFLYTGEATQAEGGKYGQMLCINCIAVENTKTGTTASFNAGFAVESSNNRMELYNCISINNAYGYYVNTGAYAKIVNCYSSGDTTIKNGNNITVITPSVVE